MQILNNFGIQPILLLAQIVNFLIILFVLKKFFYKPITKALNERKERIAESLKNAQAIEQKLTETDEKSAKIIEAAQNQAQTFLTEAKKEAQRISDEANFEAKKTIEMSLKETQAQIELQKQQLKLELEKETITLVSQIVKKVLGRSLKSEEKNQLTAKSLSEITRSINE